MSKNKQILSVCIFLTIATITAFWQVNTCEFNDYDDEDYVTKNSQVQNGITMEGVRWAFTTGHAANWHPLTWISHMLDVQLFGLQPRWHHLTNLLFHIVNTLLLFVVLHRMTNGLWQSAFVAALFALHPLHVESVAWVAERKDVLSAFFWLLTMSAYCRYVERPKLQGYLIVVVLFVLGLMSKPMLVTLPFVLLLLDYWPLQRFRQDTSQSMRTAAKKPGSGDKQKGKAKKPADARFQWALLRPLLWEKMPLFALAAASSIVTYVVQQKGGAVASIDAVPIGFRIENAFVSYIGYILTMIWPADLAVLYPLPSLLPTWQVVVAVFLLTAVTIAVIWKAGKAPYLAVGWLWYFGALVPVIGIVQVGLQARADRYTYLPLIGLFIMAAWGLPELFKKWRSGKEALIVLSTAALACLGIATWTQVRYWQDSIALFGRAIDVTDNNYPAYYNRGTTFAGQGNYRQAISDYDKVIEINPKHREAYNNRGNAYATLGNYQQAIGNYDKAIELDPNNKNAFNNRGNAYLLLGNHQQAIGDYDKAIELDPAYTEAYANRGYAYSSLDNHRQAIDDLKKAAKLGNAAARKLLTEKGIAW